MAVITPATNPSTSATSLKSRVQELSQKLHKLGAKDGARRIEMVEQQIQHFTVEGAFQYIRKEEILDEVEMQGNWWLHLLHGARNFLSVAPIAYTWWALHLAADAYDQDLLDTSHYPNDIYQPFLRLWQESFHGNHGPIISFSSAALMDALLLSGLILLVVLVIPWYEQHRRKAVRTSLGDFDGVIDDLLAAIGKDGANSHLAPSDVNKISQAIKDQLRDVLLNYDRVAIETREMVKDTHQETNNLIQSFNTDLKVFNTDINLLTSDLKKLDINLGNYGQKLTELTDASNKLAGSSNDLASNAKSMADSATESAKASQGISTQLGELNKAQQEIVKTQQDVAGTIAKTQQDVVTKIAQTQGDVVNQFSSTQQTVVQEIERAQKEVVRDMSDISNTMDESSKNTRDVARELENVVQSVKQFTQIDLQTMTDSVKQSNQVLVQEVQKVANQAAHVVGALGQVDANLQLTTKALADAAKAMSLTTKRWWQFWK